MVKVFRVCYSEPQPTEENLLSDPAAVRMEVSAMGHLLLFSDSQKVIHIIAPGEWLRAEVV